MRSYAVGNVSIKDLRTRSAVLLRHKIQFNHNFEGIYDDNEFFDENLLNEEFDEELTGRLSVWVKQMISLTRKEEFSKKVYPRRGEIWTVHLGKNVGSELTKTRPCLIVQNNSGNLFSPTTIIIPLSNRPQKQPTHLKLHGKSFSFVESHLEGTTLAEQIKVISKARLGRKVGELSPDAMRGINETLKISLDLN